MTVLRNLPSHLILAHAPWLLGGGLIVCIVACAAAGLALLAEGEIAGLATVAAGAGVPLTIFALTVTRDQLILDATSQTATVQRRRLFVYQTTTYPLDIVRRAELETLSDTARPILTFHDRTPPYPLVTAFNTGNGARHATETINTWLRSAGRTQRQ